MRELSLFTGAGGGLLGTKLLGFQHVGYVEWNEYCQRVIAARIRDGYLDNAPIFGDIDAFISEGFASSYQGLVDVVTGGFPCQPHSVAGRKLAGADSRDRWPSTREVILQVQPRFCLLENVPGIVSNGYISQVLGDLAEMGFNAEWGCISAGAFGASHLRNRWWVLAYSSSLRQQGSGKPKQSFYQEAHKNWETSGIIDAFRQGSLPYLCREHDDMADGMERLTALGNGQVPIVAAAAWRILSERAKHHHLASQG